MTDGSTRIVVRISPSTTALLNQIARKVVHTDPLPQELTATILGLFWTDLRAFPSSLLFQDILLSFFRQLISARY